MKLDELDKNLKIDCALTRADTVWYDARKAPFRIYGLDRPEDASLPLHRLPPAVAEATSDGVAALNYHTAGGRVRFATDSPYILLQCITAEPMTCMPHMPFSGSQGFDLYAHTEAGEVFQKAFIPPMESLGKTEFSGAFDRGSTALTDFTLDLPLYGTCRDLRIGLAAGAALREGRPYPNPLPVVFYGSSITQGGCASRPGSAYPALLSRRFDFDYIDLGFSGNGKGEDAIVDAMAALPMRAFVSDYDHNAPSLAHLQKTLPNLYQKIRASHPSIPFFFLSSPALQLGMERRDYIFSVYREARLAGDRNCFFIDGADMFRGDFADACTVDGCHPTDLGFFRMYQAVAEYMKLVL